MESWLKFRAPGLTTPMGLSIGKLVFSALNKVEWAFASLIVISVYTHSGEIPPADQMLLFIIIVILIIQTTWLLPALNRRAKAMISGKTISPSYLHRYFIIL